MTNLEVQAIVEKFLSECKEYNFTPSCTGTCVKVERRFAPGDKQAFTECDMMAGGVLDVIPQRGGSQFGTDGGSIGGAIGLQNGKFHLTATGCSKRVCAAIKKKIG